MREATIAIHGGEVEDGPPPSPPPSIKLPTTAGTVLEEFPELTYSRLEHPNRQELERVVAKLEGGAFGVAFGSGMAAISAALENVQAGDHVLVARDIYGGTHHLAESVLPRRGVSASFFNSLDPSDIERQAKTNSKLLIFESPTNPTLQIRISRPWPR